MAQEEDCQDLRLTFILAERPQDVALSLHSTRNTSIVYFPEDHRPFSNPDATVIQEICLPPEDCYLLHIIDTAQNSSSSDAEASTTLATRAYSLSFGPNHLGVYDSTIEPCFFVQWYQFGNRCLEPDASQWSVFHGSIACHNDDNNSTDSDLIIKENNVTLTFPDVAVPVAPSRSPEKMSSSPSAEPSVAPNTEPSVHPVAEPSQSPSGEPSSRPSSFLSNTTAAPSAHSDTTVDPDAVALGTPSAVPSDWPSSMPSSVPTAGCILFSFAVRTDDAPEDLILTLVSTRAFGADDDLVLWDHVRPWNSSASSNVTSGWNNATETNTTNTTNSTTAITESVTTCLSRGECYTFYVEDARRDGLTAGHPGYYTLALDDRILAYYDATVHGCYGRNVYKFGNDVDCTFLETTEPEDRSCPQVRRRRL